MDRGCLKVELKPLGLKRKPTTPEELRIAIQRVLTALSGLHAINWVHRDIRWPNIIFVPNRGWFLIDLEWAGQAGVDQRPNLKDKYIPPELKKEGSTWGKSGDMWQVGMLLKEASEVCDERGGELMNNLLCEEPSLRCTVEQALDHPWLKGDRIG